MRLVCFGWLFGRLVFWVPCCVRLVCQLVGVLGSLASWLVGVLGSLVGISVSWLVDLLIN